MFCRAWVDGEVSTNGLFHLPHLKSLSLWGAVFLIGLESPALQRLKINFFKFRDEYGGIEDASGLVAFLCRSRPRPNTLFPSVLTERLSELSCRRVWRYVSAHSFRDLCLNFRRELTSASICNIT